MAPPRPASRRPKAGAASRRSAAPPAKRRGGGSKGPPALLVYGGIGVVALALLLYIVFADGDSTPAMPSPASKAASEPEKPRILTESEWTRAKSLAGDGLRLAAEAQSLRDGGDETGYQRVAKEASAKLDAAIRIWTDWADAVPPEVSDKYSHYGEDVRRWNLKRRSLPR